MLDKLSLLVTPKLECNSKPGAATAPGACRSEGPRSWTDLLEHKQEAQAGRMVFTGERRMIQAVTQEARAEALQGKSTHLEPC